MTQEDYVSFETAKLLKEKGFDGPCYKVWESHGDSQTLVGASWFVEGETVVNRQSVDAAAKQYAYEYNLNNKVEGYLAPTHQMAMKWLRKEHNLHCNSDYDIVLGWYCQITSLTETVEYDYEEMRHYHPENDHGFSSPEEACEEAIKYCLENLI